MIRFQSILLILFLCFRVAAEVPDTVKETWGAFDPQAEPLETEVIREEIEEGIVLRYVRYVVGTFEGKKPRVAAFYAFPEGGEDLPGIVQIHGGGQFARKALVRYYAGLGYAAIAVNWGEKTIDQKDDPNTKWLGIPAGFLEPTHHNEVDPDKGTLHEKPHPWNSSWLLYSAAARRAITFLEEQPECDGSRIGVQGHSMGGRLTVLTAIDPRVKAASPSVGGSGYLYEDLRGVPGSARRMPEGPARDLYLKTIDCKEYWPLITCPVMFLGATNDFNSPMELVFRGFRNLPNPERSRASFTPHMNHRFTADNFAARVRWFDTHLKGEFVFPKTPDFGMTLNTDDGIPHVSVEPDQSVPYPIKKVSIFYGYERDPRVRFWHSAEVVQSGRNFIGKCPVLALDEPIFAFANVTYDTGEILPMPAGYEDTSLLTVTSEYSFAYPLYPNSAGVKPVTERTRLIDDFSHGMRDWSLVSANNRHHWNFETYKVGDALHFGPRGASLLLELETGEADNTLAIILTTDQWRSYTGRKTKRYVAFVPVPKKGGNSISLKLGDFSTEDGEVLESYDFVTSLALTPGWKEDPSRFPEMWKGRIPIFHSLRWDGGEFQDRPKPYLSIGASKTDAGASFDEQFQNGIRESIEREEQDRKEVE